MKKAEDTTIHLLRNLCLLALLVALAATILVKLWSEHNIKYPFIREDMGYGGVYK